MIYKLNLTRSHKEGHKNHKEFVKNLLSFHKGVGGSYSGEGLAADSERTSRFELLVFHRLKMAVSNLMPFNYACQQARVPFLR
jgi:hypothetical protein